MICQDASEVDRLFVVQLSFVFDDRNECLECLAHEAQSNIADNLDRAFAAVTRVLFRHWFTFSLRPLTLDCFDCPICASELPSPATLTDKRSDRRPRQYKN